MMNISILFSKKTILIITTIILISSMIMLAISYRIPTKNTSYRKITYVELNAYTGSVFLVKPVIIYDYQERVEASETYYDLVKGVNVTLLFKPLTNTNTDRGRIIYYNESYKIQPVLKTSIYSREYPLKQIITSEKPLRLTLVVNYNGIREVINTIEKELSTRIVKYEYTIKVKYILTVKYSSGRIYTYTLNPVINIVFDQDLNNVKVSSENTYKKYDTKIVSSHINYLPYTPLTISSARTIFFYTTIIATPVFFIILYNYYRGELLKHGLSPLNKYKEYIVKGRIIHESDKPVIIVEDPDILANMARKYGKILIYDRDKEELVLTMNDAIYKYRLRK